MEQYKVEITKEALQDMEDMYNYIALELLSPENAMGQYKPWIHFHSVIGLWIRNQKSRWNYDE